MLHDGITQRSLDTTTGTDRRTGPRLPYPFEVVIVWNCSLSDSTRYSIVDVSDGGFRIRCSVPLVESMTGTAIKLLPEGHDLNAAVRVVWCQPADQGGGYEAGIQRL